MNNALDNFIKGPLTSLLGLLIMCGSVYGWSIDYLTNWQGGGALMVGFALLFMRDKLPDFITQFVKALIDKFFGGPKTGASIIALLLISAQSYAQVVSDTVMTTNNQDNILNKTYKPSRMYNMLNQVIRSKVNFNDTLRSHFYIDGGVNTGDEDNGYQIHFGEGRPILEFGVFPSDATSTSFFYVFPQNLLYQNATGNGYVDFNSEGQIIRDTGLSGTLDASAILELQSNDKALLLPRIPSGSLSTPVNGMVYYNTTTNKVQFYQNGAVVDGNGTNNYCLALQGTATSFNDATTYYSGMLPNTWTTTTTIRKVYIRVACTLKIAEIYSQSATAGTNESWDMYVRKNNSSDTLIGTVSASTGERIWTNSSLNISFSPGDYLEIKTTTPTWATNPVTTVTTGYLFFEIN